jgi:hypothetical protein
MDRTATDRPLPFWAGAVFPDGKLKRESPRCQETLSSNRQTGRSRRKGDPVMRKTLALVVATTALTAAISLAAWNAMQANADGTPSPFAALFDDAAQALPLFLASGDDDDDAHRYRKTARRGHDDDDCDDDHDDDDDDDDHDCRGAARNPAPAGSMSPPQNGLFGNGSAPQVQVN